MAATTRSVLVSSLLLCALAACAQAFSNIGEFVSMGSEFSTAFKLINTTGLEGVLGQHFSGSVFLPTNDAFKHAQAFMKTLTPMQTKRLLMYHITNAYIRNTWFIKNPPAMLLTWLDNQKVTLSEKSDMFYVDDSHVITIRNIGTAKIFVISDVLKPNL